MAELDEVVQRILLEGDDEVLSRLQKVGSEGAEKIAQLAEACEAGASRMTALTTAVSILGTAITGVGATLLDFTKEQDEAAQKAIALSDAFGTTLGGLQGLEAAFAAGGVSVQVFERFANRLTLSIAQQWPAIAENVRTYATAAEAAQERVAVAILKGREAQLALQQSTGNFAAQAEANNSRVATSYLALQFSASKALQQIQHDIQSVEAANLGLEQAQQRLDELQGKPVSDADKKALEIKQAQLAVDRARQAANDALQAQQEHQAEAAQKQRDIETAYAEARRKQFNDEQQEQLTRIKLEQAVRESVTARAEAEERAQKLALTNVASISTALGGIVTRNRDAAKSIDLTQVSVQNLERGIIKLAASGKDLPPTGFQTMIKLSEVLAADTEHLIPQTERLALVQKLAVTSITNTGAATADLLKVLERGPDNLRKFNDAAKDAVPPEAVHNIKEFNDAINELSLQATLTKQSLAAALSPAFTEILKQMTASLQSSTGTLHLFVDGLRGIIAAISGLVAGFNAVFEAIDHAFNLQKGTAFQVLLYTILGVVAAFAAAWAAVPAAIALVVTAVGLLYDNWDKLKKIVADVWDTFMNSAVVKWLKDFYDNLKRIGDYIKTIFTGAAPQGALAAGSQQGSNSENAIEGHAGGGEIHGPGTTTSDSILARLSRGEFVMRASAVSAYGKDFMHAINNMALPGFATGGLVPSPTRLPGSGSAPPTSVLNLTLDGRTFSGLRGPKNTIDDLTSYAVSRQTSAAGSNPSWMK